MTASEPPPARPSNWQRGKAFQLIAREAVERLIAEPVGLEISIPIGVPPKTRLFDLASATKRIVGECKAFSWTASGNVPSAKITTLREACQYLRLLPDGTTRLLLMARSVHPRTGEPLADYFCRLNTHLLGDVVVLEIGEFGSLRPVRGHPPKPLGPPGY
jgi:hypothetical protein